MLVLADVTVSAPIGRTAGVARVRRRVPRWGISVALLAIVSWLALRVPTNRGRERERRLAIAACAAESWSAPRSAGTLPRGTFLRSPSLASAGVSTYVAGLPSSAGRASISPDDSSRSYRIFGLDGAALGVPAGDFRFENARILGGPDARLHLIWGERGPRHARSSADSLGPPIRVGTLWHSVYAPESGWSPARILVAQSGDGDGLLWNSESSAAVVAPSGRIHIVVPRVNRELVYLSYAERSWEVDSIPAKALYASVAEGSDGERYIAYIGRAPGRSQMNALLFVRSASSGDAWSNPKPIDGAERGGATRPRLLTGADGSLHLMWAMSAPGTLLSSAVRHASSRNGGRTWSRHTELALPSEPFTKWRAGLDGCGNPHVVVSTWVRRDSTPVGRVLQSAMGLNGWTPLTTLVNGSSAREIEVASDRSGALSLVASVEQSTPGDRSPRYVVTLFRFGRRVEAKQSASR